METPFREFCQTPGSEFCLKIHDPYRSYSIDMIDENNRLLMGYTPAESGVPPKR